MRRERAPTTAQEYTAGPAPSAGPAPPSLQRPAPTCSRTTRPSRPSRCLDTTAQQAPTPSASPKTTLLLNVLQKVGALLCRHRTYQSALHIIANTLPLKSRIGRRKPHGDVCVSASLRVHTELGWGFLLLESRLPPSGRPLPPPVVTPEDWRCDVSRLPPPAPPLAPHRQQTVARDVDYATDTPLLSVRLSVAAVTASALLRLTQRTLLPPTVASAPLTHSFLARVRRQGCHTNTSSRIR